MIKAEGYKAFHGTMRITPKRAGAEPFEITGDWIYKPEYDCWYGSGHSYMSGICEVVEDESVISYAHWERIENEDQLTSELLRIMHPESPKTVDAIFKCSSCGRKVSFLTLDDENIYERFTNQYPYCHCGAKMVLEEN